VNSESKQLTVKLNMDIQRALLDSLMGGQRNIDLDDKSQKLWDDKTVCKDYLVAFCPYKLFEGTRFDIGECNKIHEEHFRRQYASKADMKIKARYERRLLGFLLDALKKLDGRIEREKERLELEAATKGNDDPEGQGSTKEDIEQVVFSEAQKAKIEEINRKIGEKKVQMEQYGNVGNVDKATELLAEVDRLVKNKQELLDKAQTQARWKNTNHMICETCGLLLDKEEDYTRNVSHFNGRTHTGFAQYRETAAELCRREKERMSNDKRSPRSKSEDKNEAKPPRLRVTGKGEKRSPLSKSRISRRRSPRRRSKSRSNHRRRSRSRSNQYKRKRSSSRGRKRRRKRTRSTDRRRSRSRDRRKSKSRSWRSPGYKSKSQSNSNSKQKSSRDRRSRSSVRSRDRRRS